MMRHVSRTDRVALDCLCDRINLEPKIQIKYVYTKNQFADILPTEVSREMSGITFCVYSTYVFFRHILAQAISKVLSLKSESALWLVPLRNEDKTLHSLVGLSLSVQVSLRPGCRYTWELPTSASELEPPQFPKARLILVLLYSFPVLTGDPDPCDETLSLYWPCITRLEGRAFAITRVRGRYQHGATCSSITRNGEHDILQLSIRGKSSNNFHVRSGFLQEQRIGVGVVHDNVDEGSQPFWAKFPREFLKSLRNWSKNNWKKLWMWRPWITSHPHGQDQHFATIKWLSGRRQKFVSTQTQFYACVK